MAAIAALGDSQMQTGMPGCVKEFDSNALTPMFGSSSAAAIDRREAHLRSPGRALWS